MADKIGRTSIDNNDYYIILAPIAAPGFFVSVDQEAVALRFKFEYSESNYDRILAGVKMPFKKIQTAGYDKRWYAAGDVIGYFSTNTGSAIVVVSPEAIF